MSAKDGEESSHGLAEIRGGGPLVREPDDAEGEDGHRKSDEEDPETEVRARGVPVDDLLRGVRWLKLSGLNAAKEERGHEEDGGEEEGDFERCEGAAKDLHDDTLHRKVKIVN